MSELATLDKKRIGELVKECPADKRRVMSQALQSAANYASRALKDFGRAGDLVEEMFVNERALGEHLNTLFANGQMGRGGDTSKVKNFTLESFGLEKKHAGLVRQIADEMTEAELRAWVQEHTDGERRVLPKLWSLQAKNAHVSNNAGEHEWYTPPEYIEAARKVMGEIDLDPATSKTAQKIVKAKRFYTADDDGLGKKWEGRVWLNPPYEQPLVSQFCEKMLDSFGAGEVLQACVLVNNATETQWLQPLLKCAAAVCFIRGRVRFLDENGEPGAPLQGQVLLYLGGRQKKFIDAASEFGVVLCGSRK